MQWTPLHWPDSANQSFPREPAAIVAVAAGGDGDSSGCFAAFGGPQIDPPQLTDGGLHKILECNSKLQQVDVWLSPFIESDVDAERLRRFDHILLPYPPRGRNNFSITPLDTQGTRLLLFGGVDGRRSDINCLGDIWILDFSRSASMDNASDLDANCETEEIFFASEHRSEIQAKSKAKAKPRRLKKETENKDRETQSPVFKLPNILGSPRSDSSEDEGDGSLRKTSKALPQSFDEVKAKMKGMQVEHQRMVDSKETDVDDEENANRCLTMFSKAARWIRPKQHGVVVPSPRAGHVAALAIAADDSEDAVVLLHGGVDDGGAALDDSYCMRISEDSEGMLDAIWTPASGGYLANDTGEVTKPPARAFHSAVVWPNSSRHTLVVFGGATLGAAGDVCVLDDLWLLTRSNSDDCKASWRRSNFAGPSPSSRWGHTANLVGGLHGAGTIMLLCGGADVAGKSLTDCWIADLENMRWDKLQHSSASMGLGCAEWADAMQAVIFWGGGSLGKWRETEAAFDKRLQALNQRKEAANCMAKQEERQRRLAERRAAAEEKRRLAGEQSERDAAARAAQEEAERKEAEVKQAELNAWRQRQAEQRREELQAMKEAEAKQQQEREALKECRRGGGFDLDKAAAIRGPAYSKDSSVAAQAEARDPGLRRMIPVPVRPNFSGWTKQEVPDSESPSAEQKVSAPVVPSIPPFKHVEMRSRSNSKSNSVPLRPHPTMQRSWSNASLRPGSKDNSRQLRNAGNIMVGGRRTPGR